jgi:chromosome segregation ATPase
MLHHNIAILDKEREVAKLNSLIGDEEKKLHAAKKAFEEDTQRFNTFLFEAKQVGDRLEEQFKETNDNKRALEDQV